MNCITCFAKLKTRDQKKFCSRSCAAKHNNTIKPKRRSTRTQNCRGCGVVSYPNKYGRLNVFCITCIAHKKHLQGKDRNEATIAEIAERKGANRYDQIRSHAYGLYKAEKANPLCQCCGYNKHIEICHIRPISSFPKETKLKVVNVRENILFLCPNCHWEFDHNLLSLNEINGRGGGDRTHYRAI